MRSFNVLLSHDRIFQNFIVEDGKRMLATLKRNRKQGANPVTISLATKSSFVVNKLLPVFEKYGLDLVPILGTKSIIIGLKNSMELPENYDDGFIIVESGKPNIFFKRDFEKDFIFELEDQVETMFRPGKIQVMYVRLGVDQFLLSVQNLIDKTLVAPKKLFEEGGMEISDASEISMVQAVWPELHLEVRFSDEEGTTVRALLDLNIQTEDEFLQIRRNYGDNKLTVTPYGKRM